MNRKLLAAADGNHQAMHSRSKSYSEDSTTTKRPVVVSLQAEIAEMHDP